MSSPKTRIGRDRVLTFVKSEFDSEIEELTPILGGELSAAFGFVSHGKWYVIRLNNRDTGFRKDHYAHDTFSNTNLPIPKTYLIDQLSNGLFASITEMAVGDTIEHLSTRDLKKKMQSIFDALNAVHLADISHCRFFGYWDANGKAHSPNWHAHLVTDFARVFGEVEQAFQKDHPDWPFFTDVKDTFQELLDSCPNEHCLIHGDFGYGNLLSAGGKITGVIDWDRSMYGDRLYDVAWLDLWNDEIEFAKIFFDHYRKSGVGFDNYDQRIACYGLHLGLDTMRFFAVAQRAQAFNLAKARLKRILAITADKKS